MEQQAGLGGVALVRMNATTCLPPAKLRRNRPYSQFLRALVDRCTFIAHVWQGANGQWVGADGSDPLDRMLSALMPAVQQLAHIVRSRPVEMSACTFCCACGANATEVVS